MTPESRKTFEAWIKQEAALLYATFTDSEKGVMAFGMMPAQKALGCERKLLAKFAEDEGREATSQERCEIMRLLAVGCMDAADSGPNNYKMKV